MAGQGKAARRFSQSCRAFHRDVIAPAEFRIVRSGKIPFVITDAKVASAKQEGLQCGMNILYASGELCIHGEVAVWIPSL